MSLFSGIIARLSTRMVAGIATATLAAGGTAAVVVSASSPPGGGVTVRLASQTSTTGEPSEAPESQQGTEAPDPSESEDTSETADATGSPQGTHGAAVEAAVQSCKAALASALADPSQDVDNHGIGPCVSKVASDGKARAHGDSGETESAAPSGTGHH